MSTTNSKGSKITLNRTGPDLFWQTVYEHFAGNNACKWKYLAMLALRENAGWTLDEISQAFNHSKGHISRSLKNIKTELKRIFGMAPNGLVLPDEDEYLDQMPEVEREEPVIMQFPRPVGSQPSTESFTGSGKDPESAPFNEEYRQQLLLKWEKELS